MGIFDIFSPFFSWFDAILESVLPPIARLIFWGGIASILTMWLYVLFSSQEKLSKIKREAAETKKALNEYDGDFKGAWQLIRQSLRLSLKQIGLALGPTILASLPVLFMLVWLGTAYNYRLPETGEIINLKIFPTSAEVSFSPQAKKGLEEGQWQIYWPLSDKPLQLHDATNQLITTFPLSEPVPILHKRQWWNILFGNPIGYIPEDAILEKVEIALPENKYIKFGPEWMQFSEAVFLLVVIIGSLAIKILFRIH
jgi:hypothetical protein